jgi:hypothetical protein
MIEDYTQDDKIDIGKKSTLLSLCKEKLNEMKTIIKINI